MSGRGTEVEFLKDLTTSALVGNVPCEIMGGWDMAANLRKSLFSVTNVKVISYAFQQYVV